MGLEDEANLIKKERLCALSLLVFVIICTICDVFEDLHEGSTISHVLSEGAVVLLCLAGCTYLWRRIVGNWQSTTAGIRDQLSVHREDARKWKEAHSSLSKGLSDAIDTQLDDWGLSEAEKAITFLLMKGLSFKEIADIRNTSEHTVRQQAGTVYRKSGLEGRSQLSAFFLEDLLVLSGSS